MLAAGIAEQIGVDCGIAIPGRIELLAIRKPTGVLDHHGVLVGQLGAVTLDQRLRDQRINRTLTVHVDGRLAVLARVTFGRLAGTSLTSSPVAFSKSLDLDTNVIARM